MPPRERERPDSSFRFYVAALRMDANLRR
jgi:hypothetical protein